MRLARARQAHIHWAGLGDDDMATSIALVNVDRYSPTVPMLASPDHYLFAFEGDNAIMLAMDPPAYRRSIFLDDRIDTASETVQHPPVAGLEAPYPAPVAGWIFHIAHCGSTLLARALDQGDRLVLREPLALRQLGINSAGGILPVGWQARLALVTGLLARRYDPAAMTIVKANVPVNFIIPEIMADAPAAPAILLHFPLGDYLAAILRSPASRQWLRGISETLRPAIITVAGSLPDDDSGRAAALWLAQIRIYTAALARFPNCQSLDAEALFSQPTAVLLAASALFGTPFAAEDAARITAGPLFNTYSKNPALAFDDAARRQRQAAQAAGLAPEIAAAHRWVHAQTRDSPLPDILPRPLIASGRSLLA